MKLRIRGDSIRLRVTQSELETLKTVGEISDAIRFTEESKLVYRLLTTNDVPAPQASFTADTIVVRLPESTATDWATTDAVSVRADQKIGIGAELSILVEKDFACLAPREGEDDSDMFANPDAGSSNC